MAHDPRCSKSGVYWSWNGGPREGRGMEALEKGGQISGSGGAGGGWDSIFENDQSGKAQDVELGIDLFRFSTQVSGAEWPTPETVTSPCPTLQVIGSISKAMIDREETKRMAERPGFNADGTPVRLTRAKKTQLVADKVVGFTLKNTVGRAAGFLNRRLLGRLPTNAVEGSYQDAAQEQAIAVVNDADKQTLQDEIAELVFAPEEDQVKMTTTTSTDGEAVNV